MNIADETFKRMKADPSLSFEDAHLASITTPGLSRTETDRRAREERERAARYTNPVGDGAIRMHAKFPGVPIEECYLVAREVQERGGNGSPYDVAVARLIAEGVPTHQAMARAKAAVESRRPERPERLTANAVTLKLRELDPMLSFDDAMGLALKMNARPAGLEAEMARVLLTKKAEPHASLHALVGRG